MLDHFIFKRVQLYTYDLIHENLGFKLFWGGLVVYGWLFILPLWGMAAHPPPGSPRHDRTFGSSERLRCSCSGGASRAAPTCKNTHLSDGPTARFSTAVYGAPPATSTTWARDSFPLRLSGYSATSLIPGVKLPCLYRLAIHPASTSRRGAMRGEIRPGEVDTVSVTGEVPHFPRRLPRGPLRSRTQSSTRT